MEIGSIFLLLALLILAALFVARPFLEERRMLPISDEEHDLSALMAERDRLITTLHELDFDYALGKVPADDYPVTRAELMQRAANVLRGLDGFQTSQVAPDAAEDRVEAAVAARRADAAQSPSSRPEANEDIEALIAARKASRKEKSGGFCSKCGKPILHSDRFCPHCGKSIN